MDHFEFAQPELRESQERVRLGRVGERIEVGLQVAGVPVDVDHPDNTGLGGIAWPGRAPASQLESLEKRLPAVVDAGWIGAPAPVVIFDEIEVAASGERGMHYGAVPVAEWPIPMIGRSAKLNRHWVGMLVPPVRTGMPNAASVRRKTV